MNSDKRERWARIKSLFNQAAEKSPADRTAFLDNLNDDDIRREVESLLAIHDLEKEDEDKSLEQIVALAAADLITSETKSLAVGQTFGQYRIERELGRGGMGEVYLVRDPKFGRLLALKVLSSSINQDPSRLRRFEQEARAVFTLNHPNIITIHETGEVDGQRFLITEFVDGQTLREIFSRGERDLIRLLKIVLQVAEALIAAHSAGIIHRDIKPENIMVRHDGYAKVLDFGLAKPTEESPALDSASAWYPETISTAPGLVLGTVNYMSPEQARGHSVDYRSDIFSLGVVLYEAVTGHAPFTGETKSDVVIAIAGQEPPLIAEYNPEAPADLQHIIDMALRKKREDRYQTLEEMHSDLEAVKDNLVAATRSSSGAIAAQRRSSAEYLLGEIKRNKFRVAIAAVAVLAIIAGVSIGLYKLLAPTGSKSPLSSGNLRFTKLTSTGKAVASLISPDGKYVVYGSYDDSLTIKQMATGSSTRLLATDNKFAIYGCTFTPDSSYVYCWSQELANLKNSFIERIPVIPGRPQKIVDHASSAVSFSPDGKHMAFLRFDDAGIDDQITIADIDGNIERALPRVKDNSLLKGVAWSPDGKTIVAQGQVQENNERYYRLFAFSAADGSPIDFSLKRWRVIRRIEWLPNGSGLLMTAVERSGNNEQIWFIAYPDGKAQPLTNEISSFEDVSITADGSKMLTSQSDRPASIWLLPLASPDRAKKLTSLEGRFGDLAWTPDGHIVYTLGTDLWIMSSDGSGQRQLTTGQGINKDPHLTADGRYILFSSSRAGDYNIWRLDLTSGELRQLTSRGTQIHPLCTPDGLSYVYASRGQDKTRIWKAPLAGGDAIQIGETNMEETLMAISPDGKSLSYQFKDDSTGREYTAIQPIDGGASRTLFPAQGRYNLQWSSDGRGLIYADTTDIWLQPIDGGQPKRLTNFLQQQAIFFALSDDGKNLLVTRGDWTSDVVLIDLK